MNLTDKPAGHDTNEDVRRLIDAGYSVTFTAPPSGYDSPAYMVTVTSEFGSRWRGVAGTPGGALRAVWPLGYASGQGGCGHCGRMGCTVADCPVCAAYGPAIAGNCGVCGYTDPDAINAEDDDEDEEEEDSDDLDPYCAECGTGIGIFWGHGDGWHHWRKASDGRTEIYDAGHAPVVAWRPAGAQ